VTRTPLLTVAAGLSALLLTPAGMAQSPTPMSAPPPAPTQLAAARAALRAKNLDSAAGLLRQAVDSATSPSRGDRVDAWVLLGIVEFYQGKDSATASDFRQALALSPDLAVPGLAQYDSALGALFATQRVAMIARPTGHNMVADCTVLCPGDVVKPHLVRLPRPDWPPLDMFEAQHTIPGVVTIRYVVDTAGRVIPGSIGVVRSTVLLKEVQRVMLLALGDAEFQPGRAGDHAVPVLVQSDIHFGRMRYGFWWRLSGGLR